MTITVKNVTRKGTVGNWDGNVYHADIEPRKSIRLYGFIRDAATPFEQVFRIGERAVYDSYNLIYTGIIESIGERTVSIRDNGGKMHRLSLYEFCWRNCDFDLARIEDSNARESVCI